MELTDMPDELIYGICHQMDMPDLKRFIRSNSRIRSICTEVLDKLIQLTSWLEDAEGAAIQYVRKTKTGTSYVDFLLLTDRKFRVYQFNHPPGHQES